MLGIAFEVRTACSGCGQALPLNAAAEHITCASCGKANTFSPDRWKQLVEDGFAAAPELAPDEGKNVQMFLAGTQFHVTYGRQAPRCSGCKTPLPPEMAQYADRGWAICVGCGKRTSIRRAPPWMAALGATFLVGEQESQLAGAGGAAVAPPRAAQPVVLMCPQCQGALSVDGSSRMVKCGYCSTDVYLPDDLWQRLHPAATVARWYAWMPEVDLAERRRSNFKWYSLSDVAIDRNGNLYCTGSAEDVFDDGPVVWCMGADLTPRWFVQVPGYDDDAKLTLLADGRVLVWKEDKSSVALLSPADGSMLGKLGGREPDGAHIHHLDLERGKRVLGDVDGTILALIGERLVRYAPDGTGIPTWPPQAGLFGKKAEKPRGLYGPNHEMPDLDGVYVENIGNQPTAIDDYSHLVLGWDGSLYIERAEWVARFDRSGARVYKVKLPIESMRGDSLGVDGGGNLYVLGALRGDPRPRVLVRVSPDGRRVDVIAGDRRMGGVLGEEETMVVTPQGWIYLMRYGMRVRVLGPDGAVLHQTAKSKESDAEEDQRIADRS